VLKAYGPIVDKLEHGLKSTAAKELQPLKEFSSMVTRLEPLRPLPDGTDRTCKVAKLTALQKQYTDTMVREVGSTTLIKPVSRNA
jgi:hypothetical protein